MSGEIAELAGTVVPGGQYGVWGMAAAALVGGFVFLRQYLSKGAADRADDDARVTGSKLLREMLESERARSLQAEIRADGFAKERNDAIGAMGLMKGQMEAMTQQLNATTARMEEATAELKEAREEIQRLRRTLEINGGVKP